MAELRWRLEGRDSTIWNELAPANLLAPRGTARDFARIMAGVVTGTFLSPEISATMRRHLEWPMELDGMDEIARAFGTKGGSLATILTEATSAVPRVGDFAGQPRVTVLFMRKMTVLSYLTMTRTSSRQLFIMGTLFRRRLGREGAAVACSRE